MDNAVGRSSSMGRRPVARCSMLQRARWWSSLGLLWLLIGCATTDCLPRSAGSNPTPAEVANAAEGAHAGQLVQWGGVLIASRQRQARTELEVLAYPLDRCGRPQVQAPSIGRFVIERPGYLEMSDHPAGDLVTVTGHLLGRTEGRLGEAVYRLPVVEGFKPQFWARDGRDEAGLTPWLSIGIGSGRGGVGGGVDVVF